MPKTYNEIVAARECARCQSRIFLIKAGDHYKWVTNPFQDNSWHCGNDPLFPVLAHAPKEET